MANWQVGDKAVCISATPLCAQCIDDGDPRIAKGDVLTVTGVFRLPWHTLPGLDFAEAPEGEPGWCACVFRKVVHDKQEACEEEFVTLIKRNRVPASAGEAGTAKTAQTGLVHEHAAPKGDAQ